MKKTTLWAVGLALAGMVIVSCDSTSSPPADTNPDGGGSTTTTDPAIITLISPYTGDTTVPNEIATLPLRFKATPKSGVAGKVNGTSFPQNSAGEFTAKTNLSVGVNKFVVTAVNTGKIDTQIVNITRQLGAPILKATTGQAGQTDFTDSVTVQFNAADLSTDSIRYTTAGATAKIPSSIPLVGSGFTVKIKGTTTFRAISMRSNAAGTVYSDTTTVTFLIGKTLGKPYFSTNKVDSFNTVSKISIGGFGVGDTVRYTTDGGDPTRNSFIYSMTDSILVQSSVTIIGKSFNGSNSSPACTTSISLNATAPIFSVKSGTYTSQRMLSIKSLSGVPVYYTTDGSTPTNQSLKAGDTLLVDSNVTIKAFASLPGWRSSSVVSATFKFKVATPTLSFKTGNYDTTQTLSITDSAAGAVIHYSLDGSNPGCGSTKYDADVQLELDSNVTVKAIACKDGWDSSDVATGNYTFKVAKITFTPDSGIYRSSRSVKLSTRSPNVTFFVTRDSTTPSWDNALAPTGTTQKKIPGDTLWVPNSQWLRVIAVRNGWANSIADSRRYIVEGDTLLVDDFEQNSLSNPIGSNWRFWACGYCVNTGISDQMETKTNTAEADWNRQIGFRNGHIDFDIPDGGAQRISDGRTGPGYAGYSVGVPSDLMGETYRISFWARWKPSGATSPTSVPMITEMAWKNNDNQNGYYHDGFHRYVETVGTTWKQYIVDYAAFFHASNAYELNTIADSTSTAPKSYWLMSYPDSARMANMGLSKFQGEVWHSGDWKPHWVWGADHDAWSKNNITNFRWSILQPSNDKSLIASLTHGEVLPALKDTLVDSTYSDSTGSHTVQVTHKTPTTIYCGDCHQPVEPGYSDALVSSLKALEGSLELDRIQLIRRPQVSGGLVPPVVVETPPDTTRK